MWKKKTAALTCRHVNRCVPSNRGQRANARKDCVLPRWERLQSMVLIPCFPKQKLISQSHLYMLRIAAILHEICTEVTWQYYFMYVCDGRASLFIAKPLSLTCRLFAEDAMFFVVFFLKCILLRLHFCSMCSQETHKRHFFRHANIFLNHADVGKA